MYGLRKLSKVVDGGSMIAIGTKPYVPQAAPIGSPSPAPATTIINGSGIDKVFEKAIKKKKIQITL